MGKGKMTLLDVRAEVKELRQALLGHRLSNVYSLDSKTFVLRFDGGSGKKSMLVVESGVRVHLTRYQRPKDKMPNSMASKLRKHLLTKRLEHLRQPGTDRVIDMQFGVDSGAFHVIVELYASGNLILTDSEYRIMMLLRVHRYDSGPAAAPAPAPASAERHNNNDDDDEDGAARVAVREVYPMAHATRDVTLSRESVDRAVLAAAQKECAKRAAGQVVVADPDAEPDPEPVSLRTPAAARPDGGNRPSNSNSSKKKKKKEGKDGGPAPVGLRDVLAHELGLGPDLALHCLLVAGYAPGATLEALGWDGQSAAFTLPTEHGDRLGAALGQVQALLDRLSSEPMPGYLVTRTVKKPEAPHPQSAEAPSGDLVVFHEFLPVLLAQHLAGGAYSPDKLKEVESFDVAMDEYYSNVESQTHEARLLKEEAAAWQKVQRVKDSHRLALKKLESEADASVRKASLLESHAHEVQQAIDAVRAEVARGTDWAELEQVVRDGQRDGNPVALAIHSLQLKDGKITLLLSDSMKHTRPDEEDSSSSSSSGSDEEEQGDDDQQRQGPRRRGPRQADKTLQVQVQLGLSAHANAAEYFRSKKQSVKKLDKTVEASAKAVKAATKQTEQALKQVNFRQRVQKVRKVHWFEKFHWFVSSDNYLVIGGKDAQQNEMVVRRYLGPRDVYVHADVHGAPSVVVKNHRGGDIPPRTLEQAGQMAVCRSSAWNGKVPAAAYWVRADQVSKTAPSGEYLTTGAFMVRGTRNYLPIAPLAFAFGLLFRLEDDSVARHAGERRPRLAGDDDDDDDDNGDNEGDDNTAGPSISPDGKVDKGKGDDDDDDDDEEEDRDREDDDEQPPAAPAAAAVVGVGFAGAGFAALESSSNKKPKKEEKEEEEEEEGPDFGGVDLTTRFVRGLSGVSTPSLSRGSSAVPGRLPSEPGPGKKPKKNAPKHISKTKKKKLERYKEQDEEDFMIAREVLGLQSTKRPEYLRRQRPEGTDSESEEEEDEDGVLDGAAGEREEEEDKEPQQSRICFHCKKAGHLLKDCPDRKKEEEEEAEARRRIMAEENIAAPPEESDDAAVGLELELQALTGKPVAEDTLRYVVPVTGPLGALSSYKYKVKLVPGSTKKGKATKAAVALWLKEAGLVVQERDLIRGIADDELIQAMLGNANIATAGAKKHSGGGGKKKKR